MLKRNVFIGFVLTVALLLGSKGYAQKLETEFLYKISLVLDKPLDMGNTPSGTRIAYPVKGGTFEGPNIKGKVLPVGEDWLLKVDENTNKLDVRLVLETDDDHVIACSYTGIVHKNSDGTNYWRITPIFQTGSKKYEWLNNVLAVGKGSFQNGSVSYEVFVIK